MICHRPPHNCASTGAASYYTRLGVVRTPLLHEAQVVTLFGSPTVFEQGGWRGPKEAISGWVGLGTRRQRRRIFFFAFAYRVVVKVFSLGGWVGGVEPTPPPLWV